MDYYEILGDGTAYHHHKGKNTKKCALRTVKKAMQRGGGMLYDGSTVKMWAGSNSPSGVVPRKSSVVSQTVPPEDLRRESVIVGSLPTELPSFLKFMEKPTEPAKPVEKKNIGTPRKVTALMFRDVPEFAEKIFAIRQDFIQMTQQQVSVQQFKVDYTITGLAPFGVLTKLPGVTLPVRLKDFRRVGVSQEGNDSFYRSVLSCTFTGYFDLGPDKRDTLVTRFRKSLLELFRSKLNFEGQSIQPYVLAIQTLERSHEKIARTNIESIESQLTRTNLRKQEIVYGFLSVVLGINFIILQYRADSGKDIYCRIRENNPKNPYIVLLQFNNNQYEPVFWQDDNKIYRYSYMQLNKKPLAELNDLFVLSCKEISRSRVPKRGGALMSTSSSLVVPNMWSPSDVGKPDCGQPVIPSEEPESAKTPEQAQIPRKYMELYDDVSFMITT